MGLMLEAYPIGLASADVVSQTLDVSWISHEDGGLDLAHGTGRDGYSSASNAGTRITTAAEGVVHDLTTLGDGQYIWSLSYAMGEDLPENNRQVPVVY